MARYIGPVCRLCRREGEKLFLKGDRCFSPKCAIEQRPSAPGQHGKSRGRFSEYKVQLREKQKIKRMYRMLEKPFRNLFARAQKQRGIPGEQLLILLETRLDNVVYRSGFASSRDEARQLVRHGHVLLNGKRCSAPSNSVEAGDVIQMSEKMRVNLRVQESIKSSELRVVPEWIDLNRETYVASVKDLPTRAHVTHPLKEQLVVELYSK